MSYAPINIDAYTAAFSGAVSGMAASSWLVSPATQDYALVTSIAGAFAQAFDQSWNSSAQLNNLQLKSITSVIQSDFQNRAPGPLNSSEFATPANWSRPASACAALVAQCDVYFASQGIVPSVPSVLSSTPISIVSIFNWIPAIYWPAILAGTLSTAIDLAPFIQTAFNQIGCRTLYVEQSPTAGVSATYNVGVPLLNANDDLTIQGGTRATFKAIANLDVNADGRGAIIYSPDHRLKIANLSFNLNAKTGNAIFMDRCTFPVIDASSVSNLNAGYAGLRGGSILYPYVSRFSVSGAGRCIDLQKGWELVATSSYYGSNDGYFVACKAFCNEGYRICGGNTLIRCGIESGINQPALRNETRGPNAAGFVFGEEIGSLVGSECDLIGCYEELSSGTATTLRGFYLNNLAVVHLFAGQFFGESFALANSTFMTAVDFAITTIDANTTIKSWFNDFSGSYSGASNNYTLTQLSNGAVDGDSTNLWVAGTGVQPGEVLRNVGNWGDMSLQKNGLQIARPTYGIIVQVTPNGTPGDDNHKINLGGSAAFNIGGNITIDETFLINIGRNQKFSFEFSSNTVRLSNAVFNLATGIDTTYAIGNILLFQVDANLIIRQVGGNA